MTFKVLILVVVVLLAVWLLRGGRGRSSAADEEAAPPRGRRTARDAQEALPACAHCGVHLPRSEAWPGRGGLYCSEAHRRLAEPRDGAG